MSIIHLDKAFDSIEVTAKGDPEHQLPEKDVPENSRINAEHDKKKPSPLTMHFP